MSQILYRCSNCGAIFIVLGHHCANCGYKTSQDVGSTAPLASGASPLYSGIQQAPTSPHPLFPDMGQPGYHPPTQSLPFLNYSVPLVPMPSMPVTPSVPVKPPRKHLGRLLLVALLLVGIGVSSVVPMVYSLAGKSKKMLPGVALAAVSSISFLGFLIGPPIIGFIAQVSSLRWSFALIALLGLGTTLLAEKIKQD